MRADERDMLRVQVEVITVNYIVKPRIVHSGLLPRGSFTFPPTVYTWYKVCYPS